MLLTTEGVLTHYISNNCCFDYSGGSYFPKLGRRLVRSSPTPTPHTHVLQNHKSVRESEISLVSSFIIYSFILAFIIYSFIRLSFTGSSFTHSFVRSSFTHSITRSSFIHSLVHHLLIHSFVHHLLILSFTRSSFTNSLICLSFTHGHQPFIHYV